MSIQLCVLASGSTGNCTYIGSESSAILIDAGLSGRETALRLSRIGVELAGVGAVCVTHEHNDHTAGLGVLQRRHGIPIYANSGTIEALRRCPDFDRIEWRVFTTGAEFSVGGFSIEPFSVPHDAYEPVGFIVKTGETRIGVVTDMGFPTALIREHLKHCDALVVESNHDEKLLQNAKRPWHLKQRILGRQGHLSNKTSASMVAEVCGPRLRRVYLAHLSLDCNKPELALHAVRRALKEAGHDHVEVHPTFADRVSEVWRPVTEQPAGAKTG